MSDEQKLTIINANLRRKGKAPLASLAEHVPHKNTKKRQAAAAIETVSHTTPPVEKAVVDDKPMTFDESSRKDTFVVDPQMSVEEFGRQVLKRFEANPLLWGMYYFPTYFRQDGPGFHLVILKATIENMHVAIHAPRGSSKSTIVTFLTSAHGVAFKKRHFIVIVQSTYAKAAASLNNIKMELKDNAKLAGDFGIVARKDAEGDTIFRHRDGFEVRVLCKGADQLGSLRGERFGAYRPDLIIVDDLEEDEAVKNPERRMELEKQFNEVLNYVGETGLTKMIVVGTILHDDSLLRKLLSADKYTHFKKLFFRARNRVKKDDGTWEVRSLWPQRWTVEQLNEMEKNDPAGFAKEMQGDPSSGSMEAFSRSDFRYWRVDNGMAVLFDDTGLVKARWALSECVAAIACDLAWEEKRDADESVIMPGFITPGADILVDDYINKRGMRPEELEETLFVMEERLTLITGKRVAIGFEKAKLEKVMKHLLGQAMRRRNRYLWMKDLQWDGDKLQRIMTRLANRYSQHVIYHKRTMGALENQLVRLRSAAHDDLPDALQGLVQLLVHAPRGVKPLAEVSRFDEIRRTFLGKDKGSPAPYVFGRRASESPIRAIRAV